MQKSALSFELIYNKYTKVKFSCYLGCHDFIALEERHTFGSVGKKLFMW